MSETLKKGYIDKKEKGAGEYQDLYLEGIELLQDLSGANWTDYNEHDPGVTIFENIAYTLTNLSHKVDQSIEDILTESKNKAYQIKINDSFSFEKKRSQLKPVPLKSGDNGFFVASDILTTNPVIKEDYRKMLVDGIHNVKGVWIKIHNQGQVDGRSGSKKANIQGLYHIFVEMYDYHEELEIRNKEEKRIIHKVKQLFHAQRNLCEDIFQVTILDPFYLDLKLELTLDVKVDGEDVFAQIYYNINDYLSHDARFQSLWELREEEEDLNSIYLGPTLKNGFIKDNELKPKKNGIFTSEITKIISRVPGVVRIDKFEIKEDGANKLPFNVEIIVPEQKSPRLNIPKLNEKLAFKTADVQLKPDVREIKKRYMSIEAEYYGTFKTVSESANSAEIPNGESLGISSFYSIREQFPAVYGIGKFGLPKNAPKKRKAQAKQLKAYLLPFDQLMSNFLAQLTNLYTIYDVNSSAVQTYFCQELEDMEDVKKLIKKDPKNKKTALEQWSDALKKLNSQYDTNAIKRLNEVADNLLARFAEQFPTYVLQKINTSCFGKNFTDEDFDKKLLFWKRKLVANYDRLSYNRAKSFNYTVQPDMDATIPVHNTTASIVEKMSILLGIHHSKTRNLSALVDSDKMTPQLIFEEEVEFFKDGEIKVIDKLILGVKDRVKLTGKSEVRVEDILALGVVESNYLVEKKGRTNNIILKKDQNPENNIQLMTKLADEEVDKAKAHALKFLKKMNDKSEGIHLIEHLLLAPPVLGKYFGFSFILRFSNDETLEFKQTELLDNHERNQLVDFLISNLEGGQELAFKKAYEHGNFGIEISGTDGNLLAKSISKFAIEKDVDAYIKLLENRVEKPNNFKIEEQKYYAYYDQERKVDEAFFSFRMSFILPSWPIRFQQESFRRQFTNILYEHAPIHIQYKTHWLGLKRMQAFEKNYFEWLEKLSDETMVEKRMSIAYDLIEKIKKFEESIDL